MKDGALLVCSNPSCRRRFSVRRYRPGRTYRCKACGSRLDPAPAGEGGAPGGEGAEACDSAHALTANEERLFGPVPLSGLASDDAAEEAPERARLAAHPAPGRRIGPYEILGEIGRGGMGIVFRAKQAGLGRVVALKVLLSGRDASAEEIARFQREARAAARVTHDNLVAIHDIGCDGEYHYFSMELVEGASLASLAREAGPLSPRRAAAIVRDAARGLAAAHAAGIIHRDVKPSNILIAPGDRVKVADFGLAKGGEGGGSLKTHSQAVLGTPVYMPPEQANSQFDRMGPWSDVYSLGATLYEALSGQPPYDPRGTAAQVLARMQLRNPVPLLARAPRTPRDLDTIVQVAMEPDPARRYPEAGALAADLDRFLEHRAIRARPPGRLRKAALWGRRRPALAALLAISSVAFLALGGLGARSLLLASRASSQVTRGDSALAEGDERTAIASYNEALAIDADHAEARFRRERVVGGMVDRALSEDLEAAERVLEFLARSIPDASGEESRRIQELAGRVGEVRAGQEEFEALIDRVSRAGPEELGSSMAALGQLVRRLPADRAQDDTRQREHRARIASTAATLFPWALAQEADSCAEPSQEGFFRRLCDLMDETAELDDIKVQTDLSSEVMVEALSDDWTGATRPLERLEVFPCRLEHDGWSGDQEVRVRARLAEPPASMPVRLDPGYYLFTARSEGHFPARFLLPVPARARVRARLRLFRERDLGFEVCHVPSVACEFVDTLAGGALAGSPRAAWFAKLTEAHAAVAGLPDFFAGLHEVTNRDLLDLCPEKPRWAWEPTGWEKGAWRYPSGEDDLPLRNMNRQEANQVANLACQRLPGDLAARWRITLPGKALGLLSEKERMWAGLESQDAEFWCAFHKPFRSLWPDEARSNLGTVAGSGIVAPVGSFEADVSVHGCRDLEGNVSEWLREASNDATAGGNYHSSRPGGGGEVRELRPEERRDFLGMRFVVVQGAPASPDPTDTLARLAELEAHLERDPSSLPHRLNAALLYLTQQKWVQATRHAEKALELATGDAARLARLVRIWAILWQDRLEEEGPDLSVAIADLDWLVDDDPRSSDAPRSLRAYLLFLAGELPEAIADLDYVIPRGLRLAQFERHLGKLDIEGALVFSERGGGFGYFLERNAYDMVDLPELGEQYIKLDIEFLRRIFPSGKVDNRKARERRKSQLFRLVPQIPQIVPKVARPGETEQATWGRVYGLLAGILALTGDPDDPDDPTKLVQGIVATLARQSPEGLRGLADLHLFRNEIPLAEELYGQALATVPQDPLALLGLAWCRIERARDLPGSERDSLLAEAVEILSRPGAELGLDQGLYRAIVDLDAGRLAEAASRLEGLATERPDDAAVLVYLGEVLLSLDRTEEARRALEGARRTQTSYRPLASAVESRPR
ncbi:MAG: protein kinase [Planctomycetes bacterium]|nr:protein kinase [Planctomycetota bacterium]